MTLTGKIRHRAGWFGKVVLQVEYIDALAVGLDETGYVKSWRDASVADLSELTALVYSKIDVYLPQIQEFAEEGMHGSRKSN